MSSLHHWAQRLSRAYPDCDREIETAGLGTLTLAISGTPTYKKFLSSSIYQQNLLKNRHIPPRIVKTWKYKWLTPRQEAVHQSWKSLHPHYEHVLFSDRDVELFFMHDVPEHKELYDRIRLTVQWPAGVRTRLVVELFKVLYLHRHGGVYVDMDVVCNRSLDELIEPTCSAIFSSNFSSHFCAMAQEHPLARKLATEMCDHIRESLNAQFVLPIQLAEQAWSRAITGADQLMTDGVHVYDCAFFDPASTKSMTRPFNATSFMFRFKHRDLVGSAECGSQSRLEETKEFELARIQVKQCFRDVLHCGSQPQSYNIKIFAHQLLAGTMTLEELRRKLSKTLLRVTPIWPWLHYSNREEVLATLRKKHNVSPSARRIKFMAFGGSSGYATIARDLAWTLFLQGLDMTFQPLRPGDGEAYDFDAGNDKTLLLRALCDRPLETYSHTIIYATSDQFAWSIASERGRNRHTKIVIMTMWETEHLPPHIVQAAQGADLILTPSEWNTRTYRRQFPRIPVMTLYQPIDFNESGGGGVGSTMSHTTSAKGPPREDDYVFYYIGEWTGRKGVTQLIRCFLDTFTGSDRAVLHLKTRGDVSKEAAERYLSTCRAALKDPARIILEHGLVPRERIHEIHARGNCYISLTCSEGIGLDLCHAALLGKPVIVTGWGAQTEYVRGAHFVRYHLIPAKFCDIDPKHDACARMPNCLIAPHYDPAFESWADADLAHASALMRAAYSERWNAQIDVQQFVLANFNMQKIGKDAINTLFHTPWFLDETKDQDDTKSG